MDVDEGMNIGQEHLDGGEGFEQALTALQHLPEQRDIRKDAIGLGLAHAHQEQGHQAYAPRLLGEITAPRKPPEHEQAEAHYQQARAELSTAIELYRAIEMTFWLPQAEAARAHIEGQMQ
jgi:hypothetical protein